jgi:Fe-S-cluster-containing dehydrogenase component
VTDAGSRGRPPAGPRPPVRSSTGPLRERAGIQMTGEHQAYPDWRGFVITIDPDLCNGCRICELVCSFQHSGLMSPELSNVQVRRSNRTAAIQWLVLPTCDLCAGYEEPACAKYCSCQAIRVEARV